MRRLAAALALACAALLPTLLPSTAAAKEAAPLAADEKVEQRLIAISEDLRCLVCQNESLAASRAELALALKDEVREQIRLGKSDDEIRQYLVARYGDFVLYKPPVKGTTLLLWFGPAALFLLGIGALIRYLRRRNALLRDEPLSAADLDQAEALLQGKEQKDSAP